MTDLTPEKLAEDIRRHFASARDGSINARSRDRILAALAAAEDARERAEVLAAEHERIIGQRTDERDEAVAEMLSEAARATKAEQERDELAQCMWDAYAVLGFDTDGDETPAAWIAGARSHAGFARQWLAEVKQARLAHDEMTDECVSAEARVAELKAGIKRLADAAKHPHKGPNDTDASMLREAAKRLLGGYEPGGRHTRQTVAHVISEVAALTEKEADR